jgi:hypothetical protein
VPSLPCLVVIRAADAVWGAGAAAAGVVLVGVVLAGVVLAGGVLEELVLLLLPQPAIEPTVPTTTAKTVNRASCTRPPLGLRECGSPH